MAPDKAALLGAAIDQIQRDISGEMSKVITDRVVMFKHLAGIPEVLDLHIEISTKVTYRERQAIPFTGHG